MQNRDAFFDTYYGHFSGTLQNILPKTSIQSQEMDEDSERKRSNLKVFLNLSYLTVT